MKRIAAGLLRYEPLLLTIVVAAFWYPDPNRIYSLWLVVILFAARLIAYRRLWTPTPLDGLLIAFLMLGVVNVYAAPHTRGLFILGRPLMGMALFVGMVEYARRRGKMDGILAVSTTLALLVAALALGSSQWSEKSLPFQPLITLIPKISGFPGAEKGFNVNEIAGAITFFLPLMAGMAIYSWRANRAKFAVTAAFWLLLLALFLGQSRFALAGVILALGIVIFLLIPPGRWRYAALVGLGLFTALEALIISNVFTSYADRLRDRDEYSISSRIDIFKSGLNMLRDYPLTGVGMNMYRAPVVRQRYPVPTYETRVLPHAHNEFIQIGADLGIPGLVVFAGWYVIIAVMLRRIWQRGSLKAQTVAAAVGAGLLAHAVFGMGDAIPLWDRFTFAFWWMVGIVGAQYIFLDRSSRLV